MSTKRGVKKIELVKVDLRFCDECGNLIATGYRSDIPHSHCGVCERDYCNSCYGDIHTAVHEDVYMIPCKHCRDVLAQNPKYITRLIEIKQEEETLRQEYWGIEKKIGKQSRKIFQSVKPKAVK